MPLSIKAAQLYVKEIPDSEFIETKREGYKAVEKESNYAGVTQKWIIVLSANRKKSDLKQLSKKIIKDKEIFSREHNASISCSPILNKSQLMKIVWHRSILLGFDLFEEGNRSSEKSAFRFMLLLNYKLKCAKRI